MFTSQPQAVEVYQSGAWWPGELLGWRHDDTGACQVCVRVVLGGVEESAWTDLATLRLPDRHLSVAPGPTASDAPAGLAATAGRGSARLRDVSAGVDLSSTVSLPMVRERSPNHPAGGRRRAPETGAMPAITAQATAPAPVPARGRHRAPADPGRHRAADSGLFAVVTSDPAPESVAARTPSPARGTCTEEAPAVAARGGWTVPEGVEPDLLTRPMRLTDHLPHSRRPRVDGSRSL
ncbi:MAG: hypothetical protein ACXVX8_14965 [Blastococcus sp.]